MYSIKVYLWVINSSVLFTMVLCALETQKSWFCDNKQARVKPNAWAQNRQQQHQPQKKNSTPSHQIAKTICIMPKMAPVTVSKTLQCQTTRSCTRAPRQELFFGLVRCGSVCQDSRAFFFAAVFVVSFFSAKFCMRAASANLSTSKNAQNQLRTPSREWGC